jgi:GT2 family glycosyltransferase
LHINDFCMDESPEISVLIPLYRGKDTIRQCVESLIGQTGVTLEILLLDNGCPENTGEWAGYALAKENVSWRLLEEKVNIGFAGGMNLLYKESRAPYILFLNQDVTLETEFLSIIKSSLDRHKDWGGVCGTLYRSGDDAGKLDTTGHVIFQDRIVRNRGAGKMVERGKIPWDEGEVFGISAACALYRREALESGAEVEGPFDPDFFAYFEDVDLDYRMHRSGWKLGYVPGAVGTHTLAGSGGRKEFRVRMRAYGNRWRILWKHESWESLVPDIVPILGQEIYSFFRSMLKDPMAWVAGPWIFVVSIPRIMRRRKRGNMKWGTDKGWIRTWLRAEKERWGDR